MEKFIPETRYVEVDFNPFTGPAIQRTVPTTEAQMEVFAASEMGEDANCAYVESVSLILKGELDRGAMEQTLQDLVDRHESLRSVISASGLRMVVFTHAELAIPYHDLSGLDEQARASRMQELAVADMTQPFDLLHGPLFRVQLVRTDKAEHVLRMSGHHTVLDGWSLGILMAETSVLYNARLAGTPPQLPPAVPFSKYVLATMDFAKTAEHAVVEKYWTDLFQGPVPRLDLPTDRTRPERKTFNGDRLDLSMDPKLVQALRAVATRNGASFVTTLLTAFEVLLHKLTGSSDIVTGLPAAGQSDLNMMHLVGHCVNLLALRSNVDDGVAFDDHLKERRTQVLDAFDHQKYTFGTLVHKLKVPREPGRIPLVPVVFNIDMNMDDGVDFDGLDHAFVSNPRHYENFELFLNATGQGDGLMLEWSYNTDLFDKATIHGWMQEFTTLIARITERPAATIGELVSDAPAPADAVMPPREWYGKAVPYPKDRSVNQLFDEVVAQYPEKVALEQGDQQLSYIGLQQRVLALTALLKEQGVKQGDFVGLCCQRNFGMVEAQLAILRAGAAFVPLDHTYPSDRLRFLFEDTGLQVLLTEKALNAELPKHDARVILLDGEAPRHSPQAAPQPPLDRPEAPAYIMYTSGSTGKPKGVVVPHRGIVRLVRSQNYAPFGPDAVITQLSNVSFDASTFELWGALLNGGRLVLQHQAKPTLAEVTATMERHGVNIMFITTGLFNLLVDEQVDRLKGLKCILTGGEVMSLPHIHKALRVLGPGVLHNIYGPTENTTYSCFHPVDSEADIGKQVPIGKPINNTFLYVLDEQQRPVAIGSKGELYCGGDGVALGYWERPVLTEERFLPDPFLGGESRMYRTGDLVKWLPDGSIAFLGRADDQVKIRGFRIELGEIENAISSYPGVRGRLVMARKDLPGGQQLVAYVVPDQYGPDTDAESQQAFIERLKAHLGAVLPKFMLPAFIVPLPELPLNSNGKVDKKQLPLPDLRSTRSRAEHVAPRNAMEKAVGAIWANALGVDDLGVHDNFFDLGGHSIMGIQVLAHVEQKLGRKLALSSLFQAPTVARFARLITMDKKPLNLKNLAPIQTGGNRAPLIFVHGDEANHHITRYLGNDQPFYAYFHQGENGAAFEHLTVEEIAKHYLNELISVQPEGPYLLGGYSFGSFVAYEMACQLKAAGHDVPLLVMFDMPAPQHFIERMGTGDKFYEPLKRTVMRWLVERELRKGNIRSLKLQHFHIIDNYNKAILAYRPKPYSGPVTILKAERTPGPDDMGWSNLVTGPLEVRVVPGDHYSMIKEPDVNHLVKELSKSIERAVGMHVGEAVGA